MSPTPKLRYQIKLEGDADAGSTNIRTLRLLLKRLLRGHGLRCVKAHQIADNLLNDEEGKR